MIAKRIARRRAKIRGTAGWTLPELMAALVIIAILSVIAVPTYRSLVRSSHNAEAARVLQAIRTAQERWKGGQGDGSYANLSGAISTVGSTANAYPTNAPSNALVSWAKTSLPWCTWCGGTVDWSEVDVKIGDPVVRFGYSSVAGAPGASPPAIAMRVTSSTPQTITWPAAPGFQTSAWFVMTAVGDPTGDGTPCMVMGSSFNTELTFEGACSQ
jgi:prepilin-type N-terminal cleavage/methylation domain-containing protein